MNTNKYELGLLVEAIASGLTKVKRKRGECNKITMIPPIRDKTPDYFKDVVGDFDKCMTKAV